VVSYTKYFLPNQKYTQAEVDLILEENNIESTITITLSDLSTSTVNSSATFYSSLTNQIYSTGSSHKVASNLELNIEIYTKKDNFNRAIGVIKGSANNGLGTNRTSRTMALTIIERFVESLKEYNL
jgi:hypothetical protein